MSAPFVKALILAVLGAGPALETLATGVAQGVVAVPAQAPVALQVRAESPELAGAFATLLAAKLSAAGKGAFIVEGGDGEGFARAHGARTLARVSLLLTGAELVARVEVLGTWVNFWSGKTPTRPPSPAAVLTVEVAADAAFLSWAGVVHAPSEKLPRFVLDPMPLWVSGSAPAALGTVDLEGDGRVEVIVLTEEALEVIGGDGKLRARRTLGGLPRARQPSREACGMVAAGGTPLRIGYVDGKHEHGEWLEVDVAAGQLRPVSSAKGIPCGPSGRGQVGTLNAGTNTLRVVPGGAEVVTCAGYERGATSSALLVDAEGRASWDGKPVADVGAGSALVELAGRGRPMLVTSAAGYAPPSDGLRVFADSGAVAVDLGISIPGAVMEIVGADLDGDGEPELILGVWTVGGGGELRVVRRVRP